MQRQLLGDTINELQSNIDRMTADTEETNREAGYRTTEKGNLAADLDKFVHERDAIAQYLGQLEGVYRQLSERLKATFADNRRMAAQLTSEQLEAARQIDEQAGASQ